MLEGLINYLQNSTQTLCEMAVDQDPSTLEYVPNHLKILQMCEKAVEKTICFQIRTCSYNDR